jgi:hypothetical protein
MLYDFTACSRNLGVPLGWIDKILIPFAHFLLLQRRL